MQVNYLELATYQCPHQKDRDTMNNATKKRSNKLLPGEHVVYIDEDSNERNCIIAALAEDEEYALVIAEVEDKGKFVFEETGARFGVDDGELERGKRFKPGDHVMVVRDENGLMLDKVEHRPFRIAGVTPQAHINANTKNKEKTYLTCQLATPDEVIAAHGPDNVKMCVNYVYDYQLDPILPPENVWSNDRAEDEGWALSWVTNDEGKQIAFGIKHFDGAAFGGDYDKWRKFMDYWIAQGSSYHETAQKLIDSV